MGALKQRISHVSDIMYIKHTIQLDIIEQKIKLQFEVSVIVVTELKDSYKSFSVIPDVSLLTK